MYGVDLAWEVGASQNLEKLKTRKLLRRVFPSGHRGRICKMRLQWPRFLTKPEPEVPRTPTRPGPLHGPGSLHGQDWFHKNIARRSVPTGFNSTLDTAFTNEVSSLAATPDTRWRARSGGL
ncbi:hypothetical protein TIFTF001_043755 [Ficus carica]|uniref:Uncharacterized protein n=1 Tax=Ficus carica TaxID=3494 RepID=A0AA87Z2T0_FICCA|nr:hypothetical protein TIFTF001_043755 [Ficus carica]